MSGWVECKLQGKRWFSITMDDAHNQLNELVQMDICCALDDHAIPRGDHVVIRIKPLPGQTLPLWKCRKDG